MVRFQPEQRIPARVATVLCCAAAAFGISQGIAKIVLLREGKVGLSRYASRMLAASQDVADEAGATIAKVNQDHAIPCSDDDIAEMRDAVFYARNIRDIGRVKNHTLLCSTGGGRLSVPRDIQPADIQVGTVGVLANAPLMIDRERAYGFIIMDHDVAVGMNPKTFLQLDEPPMSFSGLLSDQRGKLIPVVGHPTPLTAQQILSEKYVEKSGVFYLSKCSSKTHVCMVAIESRSAVLVANAPLRIAIVVTGTLLGVAIGLILVQAYRRRAVMEKQLRRAIRKGKLDMEYQPIVELDTNRVVGAEALVRWTDDSGTKVRPDVFVRIAEEGGFVTELTRRVATIVTDELGDLLAAGELRVTINIASPDLAHEGFAGHLQECLAKAKAHPASLGLELTERMTANHEISVRALAKLKQAGHMIYIDDFGTGYSSLSYLHQLHVDAIKIDGSFTRTIGTGAVTSSVVPQILSMAQQLNLLVVVEGIETEEQAHYFRSTGRGILGQGWHFGRPMNEAALRKFIRNDQITQSAKHAVVEE